MKPNDYAFSPVRSELQMRLDTSYAIRLWTGRPTKSGEHPIIGFPRYFQLLKVIVADSVSDNPFADEALYRIECLIQSSLDGIEHIQQYVAEKTHKSFGESLSCSYLKVEDPLVIDVYSSTPLGYRSVFLLTHFDSLAKRVLIAHRYGIMSREERNTTLSGVALDIRKSIHEAQNYKRFNVTRQDALIESPGWLKALKHFKNIDPEIMDGRKRCSFSVSLPSVNIEQGERVNQST